MEILDDEDFNLWVIEFERLKTIHNSLVSQLRDWRLLEPGVDGVWGTKVSIIEAPTIGSGPVGPKSSILLGLCVALGLLGGIGMIAVMERDMWITGDESDKDA